MKGVAVDYSADELEWISENRSLTITGLHSKFCENFQRHDVSARNLHALRKRRGWKTGRTGCFEKGNKPHPMAKPKGPNKTSFKTGRKPKNWKAAGSTRISKDGYIEVKIQEPRGWIQLHTLIWTAANGEVPSGHCVAFKDGDKVNVAPSNLELITRNENLQINRLHCSSYPGEVRPAVRNIGKLIAKTSELKG